MGISGTGLSVVEDGQRPAPAGEFAGDRGVGDGDAFAAFVERLPSGRAGVGCPPGRGPVPPDWPDPSGAAAPHLGRYARAVVPGRFDQQPADVAVAGLGDRSLRA